MEPKLIRVLLVEDDEEDYLLTRRFLCNNARMTFELTWVRTAEDALLSLQHPYDVCLVDYRLGGDTGLAVIEKAIAGGFDGPMILLTGQGDHEVDVEAMKAGAADYLVKDQLTHQLMERVLRHSIERRASEKALRQSEQQLLQSQKMEAIGGLAGGIAHDFNNLLSVILGYSELLASELRPDDPMRVDLQEINRAGARASRLTGQLLAFSRQQVLQPQLVDLNQVCSGMESMLKRLIGEDVELRSIADQRLARVLVDAGQMEQVIMNLVVNARDAMPSGGKLTIETSNRSLDERAAAEHSGLKPGAHVLLVVTDTGMGMDKSTQARMFDPFFTTKELGKGTGLGLSTVFGIVRQSGGAIWAQSERGKGTSFSVLLPATDATAYAARAASEPPQERRMLRGSETLLIVEDEEQVRVLARTILRKYGYEVLEARSGGDALLVCEQNRGAIDLLLTDVVLPLMSGPQLAARVAPMHPSMRILYMSGYTGSSETLQHLHTSGVPFLQKPLTPGRLVSRVREVLDAPWPM
jgi:two-component system, cell cycle sensor histidine kinase and response regulator CckA